MILLDDRIGSKDMRGALERQGVQVDLTRLDSCDVAFVGRGIDDEPITVGIELKRVHGSDGAKSDLLTSLRSGRLAGHQLGGMQAYERAWLITEGLWRGNDEGVLEIWERGHWQPVRAGNSFLLMGDVESQILSIITRGGLSYWHCPMQRDTIRFITRLYRWWTDKSLDEHRSHQAIYLPPPDRAIFTEQSVFLKMMSCVPGVGYDKALALNAYFEGDKDGAFDRMYTASVKGLQDVPGIGMLLAQRIYNTVHTPATAVTRSEPRGEPEPKARSRRPRVR